MSRPRRTLRLRDLALALDESDDNLAGRVARELGIAADAVMSPRIVRKSLDARRKPVLRWVCTVEFELEWSQQLLPAVASRLEETLPGAPEVLCPVTAPSTVLVVGMGPAGLFAALRLARHGVQVRLFDQGEPVERRVHTVNRFWGEGLLDPASNVQFGEGGAGTFSDGKLTTRLNHPWLRLVLETLVEFGAPAEILVQAKPHVGTDRLRLVLLRLRRHLESLGVSYRFSARLTELVIYDGMVRGGRFDGGEEILGDALVLAPGHSATATYAMLAHAGVRVVPKGFAVGFRVEHPAELIDQAQYGGPRPPQVPPAEYSLSWNDPESGRGVYSFCMCPGGEVINAASEADGLVVNGMSRYRRSGEWSNSALVVTVGPDDFDGRDALSGLRFQRNWERAAYVAGGGGFRAPAQNLLAYLGQGERPPRSSCRPGVGAADLRRLFPEFVHTGLSRALPVFNRRLRGFVSAEACLIGVETRTSAPLRILRGEDGQALGHPGLYPAGEGAGYAGGIMSAALDGLRTAEHLLTALRNRS